MFLCFSVGYFSVFLGFGSVIPAQENNLLVIAVLFLIKPLFAMFVCFCKELCEPLFSFFWF